MNNTRFLFIFAIICFFVDGATTYLTHSVTMHSILSLCLYAMVYAHSGLLLFVISLFLSMQNLIWYGQWTVHMIALLPLMFLNNLAHRLFYPTIVQLFCTCILYWYIYTCTLSFTYKDPVTQRLYTAAPLSTILIGASLIYIVTLLSGMLGNRMNTLKKIVYS